MSSTARNWIAVAAGVLSAQLAIPALDELLFAVLYDVSLSEHGVVVLNLAWLLAQVMVYLACTGVLLRLVREFRHLRWVFALGVAGSIVAWALVWWMVLGALQAGGVPDSMWKNEPYKPINVLNALAPLVGAAIGWLLWQRLSPTVPSPTT